MEDQAQTWVRKVKVNATESQSKELRLVPRLDFLDVMAWDVALSGILLSIGAMKLSYMSSSSIGEDTKGLRIGFAVAAGASGLYLFLSGMEISLMWPFTIGGGAYDVLFGGIATLGGLVFLAGSVTCFSALI